MVGDSSAEGYWVAGADACKAGWFVVLRHATGTTRRRLVADAQALLHLPESPTVLGVDMVIGLPAKAVQGGRACDRAARQYLGWPRSSSVFSPPARVALQATTYDEAQDLNRASGPDGMGLAKQAFYLLPKIRALDAVLQDVAGAAADVHEVHPECSFSALNGEEALADSKHTESGRAQRQSLLADAGFTDLDETMEVYRRTRGLNVDDILDAHAVCWTALRLHSGIAQRMPAHGPVPTDPTGLPMLIWR